MPFAHLHLHSHYSLLDGLGKIPEVLDRVAELGMPAAALTDHGVLYGLVKFWKEAKARKLHPLLGVEAYLVPDRAHFREAGGTEKQIRHLTLLAENRVGYQNLLRLISDAHVSGFYRKPCVDYARLETHSAGLVALSGCLKGDLPQAIARGDDAGAEKLIRWHLDVFGRDRFFLELQHHPTIREQETVNSELKKFGLRYGIGLVATGDPHYVRPTDAEAQDVLLCVQTGARVTDRNRLTMLGEDFSIQGPEHFTRAFHDVPEAVANTVRLAERCAVELPLGKTVLPPFPVPPGETPDTVLRAIASAGLARRFGTHPSDSARARLDYELSVIEKTGFASYFLIVQDFLAWARAHGILARPRGSAAGSIVSYLTGISDVDPLRYRLAFERFLNPERIAMPDIDVDFADDRRDEVIAYVRKKYGDDRVAQIITFGTIAARAGVRDAGRALGYPYGFCDRIAKLIPFGASLREALATSAELRQLARADPQVQRLLETAQKLEGVARNAGTHAAGVVITPTPLVEHLPLQHAPQDTRVTITQYNMHDVEDLGLLKIDFLGLKNLTILEHCVRIVRARTGVTLDLDRLPLDDTATYRLLQGGLTTGVFQLESSGMRRYLKDLQPTEFEDIVAMVALYRPGPMELIPQYIAGKHGLKVPEYLHPALAPILKKTYGIAVYQEQVLEIARDLAGFTLGEADILRKAIGKKIRALLQKQRAKFVAGATRKGVPAHVSAKVFDFIEPFAGYSFNRAHAVCYALLAYQTAYLKAHHPVAFLASLLTSDEGDTERIAIEVAEARTMGIPILPPEVNESGEHFTVVARGPDADEGKTPKADGRTEAIRFGLRAVKNVGDGVVRSIIEARAAGPFRDLGDFFRRIRTREFNRKAAESLARAGAFDQLADRGTVLSNLDALLKLHRVSQTRALDGQTSLFREGETASLRLRAGVPVPVREQLRWEKELLGLYVSGHPLDRVAPLLNGRVTPLRELASEGAESPVRVAGILTSIQRVVTKTQETMVFATLEDRTGSTEVLVFPRTLQEQSSLWIPENLVIVDGRVSERDGSWKVVCEHASLLGEDTVPPEAPRMLPEELPRPYLLVVVPEPSDRGVLLAVREFLERAPRGPVPVFVRTRTRAGLVETIRTSFRIALRPNVTRELARLVGTDHLVAVTENAETTEMLAETALPPNVAPR